MGGDEEKLQSYLAADEGTGKTLPENYRYEFQHYFWLT